MKFEYKVVPAPTRGLKAKGVKGNQARFANALQSMMNDLGLEGWEYQRTDTLPLEERQGLTGKTTTYQNMLVFRRSLSEEQTAEKPIEVAALIEDQTDTLDDASTPEDVPVIEAPLDAPIEPVAAQSDEDISPEHADGVKTRVDETLKAETFAFPWDRRTKAKKSENEAENLPAE